MTLSVPTRLGLRLNRRDINSFLPVPSCLPGNFLFPIGFIHARLTACLFDHCDHGGAGKKIDEPAQGSTVSSVDQSVARRIYSRLLRWICLLERAVGPLPAR